MLGVCYYPEHWPEDWWAADARRMRDLGIAYVRIGEFAWSHYEPRRAEFAWGWLDRAMETLGGAGLKIVLGTPTATPPKWLMDEFRRSRRSTSRDGRAVSAPADTTRSRRRHIGARARGSSKRSLSVTAGIQR